MRASLPMTSTPLRTGSTGVREIECGPDADQTAHEPLRPDRAALRESARTGHWLGQTISEPPRGIEPRTYALRAHLEVLTIRAVPSLTRPDALDASRPLLVVLGLLRTSCGLTTHGAKGTRTPDLLVAKARYGTASRHEARDRIWGRTGRRRK